MKHLKFFSTASEFNTEKPNIPTPYVAFVEDENVVCCKKQVVNPTIVLDIPSELNNKSIPLGGHLTFHTELMVKSL